MNPEGVLLALGAEPGAGAANKKETKKIKSFNGNINCCSCGFYKTHKLFSFLFLFFFLIVDWRVPPSHGIYK